MDNTVDNITQNSYEEVIQDKQISSSEIFKTQLDLSEDRQVQQEREDIQNRQLNNKCKSQLDGQSNGKAFYDQDTVVGRQKELGVYRQVDQHQFQQMRAIRRAIRKMNKKKDQKEKECKMVGVREMSVKGVSLFYNIDCLQNVYPIIGDYFLILDYKCEKISIEDQISFFQKLKRVVSAQKNDKQGIVYLNLQQSEHMHYTPLQVLNDIVANNPDPFFSFCLPYIQQHYQQMEFNTSHIHKINQIYSLESQSNIHRSRNLYFDTKVQEYIAQNFSEIDFFTYYKYSQINLNDPFCQFSKVGISYPMIALLGTDPSTFINISMRNGFLEFSNKKNKQDQVFKSMICSMELKRLKRMSSTKQNITLLTFDEYEINTSQINSCFIVDYPPHLQIEIDGETLVQEVSHFIHYQIEPNTISSLIAKRAKNPQFLKQWENEEFGYTIESQLFLEKYYQDYLTTEQQGQQEMKYQHQLKYYYNKECRYKSIQSKSINDTKTQCQHYHNLF